MQNERKHRRFQDTQWLGLGLILAGVLGLSGVNPPSIPRPSDLWHCVEHRAVTRVEKLLSEKNSQNSNAAQCREANLQSVRNIEPLRNSQLLQVGFHLISLR